MTKPIDPEAVARAMRESVKIAANGTPQQKAGMFKPTPLKSSSKRGKATA